MDDLLEQFEALRPRLVALAYRMLGSRGEAEEAVQETWLRASRAGVDGVDNVRGWLVTIAARVCLNLLRARGARPESPFGTHLPDPIVSSYGGSRPETPETEVVLADSVGLALQIVLDTLAPAERIAFVLHDMFDVPFDAIAALVERTPAAARQLASRARRRVQGAELPAPDTGLPAQRAVVEAFFAAARAGDLGRLVAVLDPDVVLRADGGTGRPDATEVLRGAETVASRAVMFTRPGARLHPVVVNGLAGVVVTVNDVPISVMSFTAVGGRIAAIHSILDPDRLAGMALPL
jgi:RNA polymerase sigma-70 factor (ECF subfamily)